MKIGIEHNLSNVKDYLERQGCQCTTIDDSYNEDDLDSFDAIVVTGQDDNLMGIEDIVTDAVVIEAAGMTPEEIYDEIQDMV